MPALPFAAAGLHALRNLSGRATIKYADGLLSILCVVVKNHPDFLALADVPIVSYSVFCQTYAVAVLHIVRSKC